MFYASKVDMHTAIIDLITGLIVIPFIIYILRLKKKESKNWIIFLSALSIGNVMGFIVHHYLWKEVIFDIFWIFLYFLLYLISYIFFIIMYERYTNNNKNKKLIKCLNVFTIIMYVLTCFHGFYTVDSITPFLIYAFIVDLPAFILVLIMAFKRKDKTLLIMLICLPLQLIGFVFEIFKVNIGIFTEDFIYHMFLLITVVILSCAAIIDLKISEKAKE